MKIINTENMRNENTKIINKVILISLSLILLLTVATACGGGSKDSKSGSKSDSKTYDVSLIDDATGMRIEPATITVDEGTDVLLKVTNDGTFGHNLSLPDGTKTADLVPYSTAELKVGKVTEDMTLFCSISGHKEQGMHFDIKIKK